MTFPKRTLRLLAITVVVALLCSAAIPDLRPAGAQSNPILAFESVDLAGGKEVTLARAAAIDLAAYPTIPESLGRAVAIAQYGQQVGRDLYTLSKVGDCNSTDWLFLHAFGLGQYDLGPYSALQPVVDHYTGSFTLNSYAAYNGMNARAVLDPQWADPSVCAPDESPLACEYRLRNPGVAVIMFGTNDLLVLSAEEFDHYLRRIVIETMQAGIVPLLSTFPRHAGQPDRSLLYNQIVVRIALDYNIPLTNFWLALETLPDYGIASDQFHLNGPLTRAADFSSESNLRTGYPMRNLVTLQALDVLLRGIFPAR